MVTGVNGAPVAQLLSWIWRFPESHWAADQVGSVEGFPPGVQPALPRCPGLPPAAQAPGAGPNLSLLEAGGRPGAPACFRPSSRPGPSTRGCPLEAGQGLSPSAFRLSQAPRGRATTNTSHFLLLPLEGQKEASEASK